MKSCQTSIPSSSQRSWNASALVGTGAGHPQHVHAGVARPSRSAARSSAADGPSPTGSIGVQTRAAGEDAHAVDVQVEPVGVDIVRGVGPAASVRNPTRPASTAIAPSRVDEQANVVQRRLAVRVRPPALDGRARAACPGRRRRRRRPPSVQARCGARRPVELQLDRARRRAVQRAERVHPPRRRRRRRRGRAGARARRGRAPPAARQPDRPPRSDDRRAGREPRRAAEERGPERSAACRRRRGCVRQRARGGAGRSSAVVSGRQRMTSSLAPGAGRPTSTSCAANIDSTSRSRSPLSSTSASVAMPSNRSTTSLARVPPATLRRSCGTTSPRASRSRSRA